MDRGAGTLSLADRQIENRGRNQSANVQAQQCITDFSKGRQEQKMNLRERKEKEEVEREGDVAGSHFHL